MSKLSRLLKKAGKAIFPGTGRHAAQRAERAANQYAQEAQADRARLTNLTAREQKRAQRLAIKGLRSRRSASFFNSTGDSPSFGAGSPTIG